VWFVLLVGRGRKEVKRKKEGNISNNVLGEKKVQVCKPSNRLIVLTKGIWLWTRIDEKHCHVITIHLDWCIHGW
jgi:hypothetical protein